MVKKKIKKTTKKIRKNKKVNKRKKFGYKGLKIKPKSVLIKKKVRRVRKEKSFLRKLVEFFFPKKSKKSKSRKERLKIYYINIIPKLKLKNFFSVVRKFFREVFHIKYEFTYEELKKEIVECKINRGLREKILRFVDELELARFSKEIDKEKFLGLKKSFKNIVESL